ncbi:unnamed protein product [Albugo candida]|uniref:Uncharacterized protein n=1 Tax=Albugo candida TaxID=65357 RepID=A0A024FY59_9STRA|nr:unnamed protein product [Albugo candida]|eukprot:CCI11594.1 unnamed protein product [Albugo candida]
MEQKYSETDLWSTRLYTHTIDQSKVDVNIYTSKSHVVIWKAAGLTFIVTMYTDDRDVMKASKRDHSKILDWGIEPGYHLKEKDIDFMARFEAFCIDQQVIKLAKHLQTRLKSTSKHA